jgi:hypothetical protein
MRQPSQRFGRTWYAVLDVGERATSAQIKVAHQRALQLLNGDALGAYQVLDPANTMLAREEIDAAAAILLDGQRRADYDRSVGVEPLAEPADDELDEADARELLGLQARSKTPVRILKPMEQVRFVAPESPPSLVAPMTVHTTVLPQAAMPPPSPRPPSVPPVTVVPTIDVAGEVNGGVLRRIREARGMSLDALASETKIRKAHLVAMEQQDFMALPDRVYLRGFLTQVARVLRVDKVALAEGYLLFVQRFGPRTSER